MISFRSYFIIAFCSVYSGPCNAIPCQHICVYKYIFHHLTKFIRKTNAERYLRFQRSRIIKNQQTSNRDKAVYLCEANDFIFTNFDCFFFFSTLYSALSSFLLNPLININKSLPHLARCWRKKSPCFIVKRLISFFSSSDNKIICQMFRCRNWIQIRRFFHLSSLFVNATNYHNQWLRGWKVKIVLGWLMAIVVK